MNIHPLFVHFPIGFLVVYALMELMPKSISSRFVWWQGAKIFMLSLGIVTAIPTLVTGDMASDLVEGRVDPALLDVHEAFALSTVGIFFILFAAYVVKVAALRGWGDWVMVRKGIFLQMWHIKQRVAGWILNTPLRPLLALAGLIAITITGGLGAAMVYGPDIDPFVSAIYHLFF